MKFKDKSVDDTVYIPPQATEEDIYMEEVPKTDKGLMDLHELLTEVDPDNAPMLSVLEAWKYKHKVLYVSKISADSSEFYVFTSIKRADFKKLQEQGVFENEEKGFEVLVEKCLLYPQPTSAWRLTSAAGVISTLGRQISYKSGFVSPQEALSLIKIV